MTKPRATVNTPETDEASRPARPAQWGRALLEQPRLKPIRAADGRWLGHGAQLAHKRLYEHARAHPPRMPRLMSRQALRWAQRIEERARARERVRTDAAVGLMLDRLMFPRPKRKAGSNPGGMARKLIMGRM